MQYLLTQEEMDKLTKGIEDGEIAKSKDTSSFKDEVTYMFKEAKSNIFLAPELMGAEVLELQIRMDYLPPNLKDYIRNIVKTH